MFYAFDENFSTFFSERRYINIDRQEEKGDEGKIAKNILYGIRMLALTVLHILFQ